MRAVICPTSATDEGREREHRVVLDSHLLKFLTTLVDIPAPGMDMHKAAGILGVAPSAMYRMIRDHRLGVRYIPGLGGQRGFPVPLVHTRGDFDPCGKGTRHLGAERMWDGLLGDVAAAIPEELESEVARVPIHDKRRGGRFLGWRWLCPGCQRRAQSLYLPLDLPDFALLQKIPIPPDEAALTLRRPPALACRGCHGIMGFSGATRANLESAWSHAIRYLSSGMLYGKEVQRPEWLRIAPSKVRHFLERDADYFAHEVERRQREEFGVKVDSSPMWVNGRINPIFDEPPAAISIDPLTNKTIRKDGTPDGLWRPQRKGKLQKTKRTRPRGKA